MKRLLLLGACVVWNGCELAPILPEGLRCGSQAGCGDGFECTDGRCVANTRDSGADAGSADAGVTDAGVTDAGGTDAGVTDAGVTDAGFEIPLGVNLLENPDFEDLGPDGGLRAWLSPTTNLIPALGINGTGAGRVEAPGNRMQLRIQGVPTLMGLTPGMLFCASIWVRAQPNPGGIAFNLVMLEDESDGGLITTISPNITPAPGAWERVRHNYTAVGTGALRVRLTGDRNGGFSAGDFFRVDSAWLSREDGGCPL